MSFSEQALLQLHTGLEQLAIPTTSAMLEQLKAYWRLVEETNQTLNLTRVTGDAAVTHHLLDAASVVPLLLEINAKRIVDIGTGLGVPGLVLAILMPSSNVVLLDALDKRIQFLMMVTDRLALQNVSARHARAEVVAHEPAMREQFDVAISRAVTALPALTELSIPLLAVGGSMVAMKGPKVHEELTDANILAPRLGSGVLQVQQVTVPFLEEERFVVRACKEQETPSSYPRRPKKLGLLK
jgi:16S rRNA (guanine527-N7)-methyltransferase